MIFEYVKTSILMIKVKPVRSVLSLLGIYIGVLSLLVILAIREGVESELENVFKTEGAKVVYIHAGFDQETRRIGQLSFDDANRLRAVDGIRSVLPRLSGAKDVKGDNTSFRADLVGVDEILSRSTKSPLIKGRNFLRDEIRFREPMCLVTLDAAKKLFPYADAVGKKIAIENQRYTIIGILNWDSTMAMRTMTQEPEIFIPYPWLVSEENTLVPMLEVQVNPETTIKEATQHVLDAISIEMPPEPNSIFVRSIEQYAEKRREMQDRISRSLLGIAAVSLIVGGIGIANVMLTSVTERIREIGLRKALGARRKDILLQFWLKPARFLERAGFLAVLTAYMGVNIYPIFASAAVAVALSPVAAAACFGLTLFVGLIAGGYPASHAAGLSPAEALRYE